MEGLLGIVLGSFLVLFWEPIQAFFNGLWGAM